MTFRSDLLYIQEMDFLCLSEFTLLLRPNIGLGQKTLTSTCSITLACCYLKDFGNNCLSLSHVSLQPVSKILKVWARINPSCLHARIIVRNHGHGRYRSKVISHEGLILLGLMTPKQVLDFSVSQSKISPYVIGVESGIDVDNSSSCSKLGGILCKPH